jgi:hypothetical protein
MPKRVIGDVWDTIQHEQSKIGLMQDATGKLEREHERLQEGMAVGWCRKT